MLIFLKRYTKLYNQVFLPSIDADVDEIKN